MRIDAQHLALVAHVGNCAVRLVLERCLVLKGQKEASRGHPVRRRLLVGNDHLVPARDAAQLLHLGRWRVDRGDGYPLGRSRVEISCVLGLQLGYLALPTLPSRCSERVAGRVRDVVKARTPVRAQRARTPIRTPRFSYTLARARMNTHKHNAQARTRPCQRDTHARCARQRRDGDLAPWRGQLGLVKRTLVVVVRLHGKGVRARCDTRQNDHCLQQQAAPRRGVMVRHGCHVPLGGTCCAALAWLRTGVVVR